MTKTLFEQYPENCAKLKQRGFHGIAEMANHFHQFSEMARAHNGSRYGSHIAKWMKGRSNPEWPSEVKARDWVDANLKTDCNYAQLTMPLPEPGPVIKITAPSMPVKTGAVLMVVCPVGSPDKIIKVLGMMGCEVVEI